jgi:low affinity Fe/Cu permease
MRRLFFSFAVLLLTAVCLVSCQNQNNGNPGNTDTTNSLNKDTTMRDSTKDTTAMGNKFWYLGKSYTYQERNKFKASADSAEKALDNDIANLQHEARTATGQVKSQYQKEVRQLKEQKRKLDIQMRKYNRITQSKWDDFKAQVTSTWSSIDSIRMNAEQKL